MMEIVARHGYVAVLVGAFLEFAGVPIPSALLLLYIGAIAGASSLSLPLLIVLAAAGALVADTLWFAIGRRHGDRLLHMYCVVSLGSRTCTERTETFFRRLGLPALLIAKFVPGLSTFAAPMAGRSGMTMSRFWAWDAAGSFVWAALLLLTGRALGGQGVAVVTGAIDQASPWFNWVLAILVVAALGLKVVRRLRSGPAQEDSLLADISGRA